MEQEKTHRSEMLNRENGKEGKKGKKEEGAI